MAKPNPSRLVRSLLDHYGKTYADEAKIRLRNTPAPLFQLLVVSILLSARIPAANALNAARALKRAGLTTAQKMAEATWQDRVDVITWHGYKRYDERTASMLGDSANLALERFGGDLRRLRQKASQDLERERQLLKQFKGIGEIGADIFLREVQVIWPEVYPFADERVLKAADRLGLGKNARTLSGFVAQKDFARLCAALVRVDLEKAYESVMKAA